MNISAEITVSQVEHLRYKHQRSTQHLLDLYETRNIDPIKAKDAISKLETINYRIKELNIENSLPEDLGVIEYGAFLYCWEQKKDRSMLKTELEAFCRRKRYMKGWTSLPPTHRYDYFTAPEDPQRDKSNILAPWLRVIWGLLRQHIDLDLVNDVQNMLIRYVNFSGSNPYHIDILQVLRSLHEMNRLLSSEHCTSYRDDFASERERLRRMCEFQGLPSEWIPAEITEKQ